MKVIKKVAVIGSGLIGMSWTSLFLARGLDVVAVDPRPEAEGESRAFVEQAWSMLRTLELTATDDLLMQMLRKYWTLKPGTTQRKS